MFLLLQAQYTVQWFLRHQFSDVTRQPNISITMCASYSVNIFLCYYIIVFCILLVTKVVQRQFNNVSVVTYSVTLPGTGISTVNLLILCDLTTVQSFSFIQTRLVYASFFCIFRYYAHLKRKSGEVMLKKTMSAIRALLLFFLSKSVYMSCVCKHNS